MRAGVVHGSPLTDLYPVIGLTRSGRLMAIWIGPCWPVVGSVNGCLPHDRATFAKLKAIIKRKSPLFISAELESR